MPPALPAGSLARGSIFAIFGAGLGPADFVQASSFPLDTALGGVTVEVRQGATAVSAIPIFVVASQVNAVIPSNAPLGRVQIRVSYKGATSNPAYANVTSDAFGIFTITGLGYGPGAIQNFVSGDSLPLNSLAVTAVPGQTLILYGTGLGPATFPDNVAPTATNLATPVEVLVGGVSAKVGYSGRSPCCSGLDQIVFEVPAAAPQGCYVPVQVRTSGTKVSNTATIAIQNGGGACSDSANTIATSLAAANKVGVIGIATVDTGNGSSLDFAAADFRQEASSPWYFNPLVSAPAPGSCFTLAGFGDVLHNGFLPGTAATGRQLNAGTTLSITASGGSANAPALPSTLGFEGILGATSILNAGAFSVANAAGSEVGTFQAKATAPPPFAWTPPSTIDRSQPLTVCWSGGDPASSAYLVVLNSDLSSNASAAALCSVPRGSQSFTVPSFVFANLPATRSLNSPARIALILRAPAAPFSASGLDSGYLTPAAAGLSSVTIR